MQMPIHLKNGWAGWPGSITRHLAPFLAFPGFPRGPSRVLCTPFINRCSSWWLTPPLPLQLPLVLADHPPYPTLSSRGRAAVSGQ